MGSSPSCQWLVVRCQFLDACAWPAGGGQGTEGFSLCCDPAAFQCAPAWDADSVCGSNGGTQRRSRAIDVCDLMIGRCDVVTMAPCIR